MKRIRRFSKRTWVLVGVVTVIAAMASIGAYAYWTAEGTGTGTATVGTDNGVTIVVTDMGAALYPGGAATVTFHIQNDSSTTPVKVDKVVLATAVDDAGYTGLASGCLSSWFSFPDVTVDEEVAAGSDGVDHTGTLSMSDPSVNQDDCKGDSFDINLKTDNTGI